jgi:hypothetical protein
MTAALAEHALASARAKNFILKESEEDVYFAQMMKKPKGRVWHVWICSGTLFAEQYTHPS